MKEAFFFYFYFFSLFFCFFSLIKNNRPTARRRVRRRGFLIIYLVFYFYFFGSRERRNLSLPLSPSFVVSGYFRGEKEGRKSMSPYLDNGLPSMSPKESMITKLFYFPVLS